MNIIRLQDWRLSHSWDIRGLASMIWGKGWRKLRKKFKGPSQGKKIIFKCQSPGNKFQNSSMGKNESIFKSSSTPWCPQFWFCDFAIYSCLLCYPLFLNYSRVVVISVRYGYLTLYQTLCSYVLKQKPCVQNTNSLCSMFSRSPFSSILNATIPLCEPASAQKTGLEHKVWYLVVQGVSIHKKITVLHYLASKNYYLLWNFGTSPGIWFLFCGKTYFHRFTLFLILTLKEIRHSCFISISHCQYEILTLISLEKSNNW